MDGLKRLRELAAQLPTGLKSDWRGSNHFELQSASDPFWLMAGDGVEWDGNPKDSEHGQRLGLIMDIAAEVAKLRDSGVL